jgi:hypothetical protein
VRVFAGPVCSVPKASAEGRAAWTWLEHGHGHDLSRRTADYPQLQRRGLERRTPSRRIFCSRVAHWSGVLVLINKRWSCLSSSASLGIALCPALPFLLRTEHLCFCIHNKTNIPGLNCNALHVFAQSELPAALAVSIVRWLRYQDLPDAVFAGPRHHLGRGQTLMASKLGLRAAPDTECSTDLANPLNHQLLAGPGAPFFAISSLSAVFLISRSTIFQSVLLHSLYPRPE